MIASVNPATGETLATFAPYTNAEVDARLALASQAHLDWRRTSVAERSRVLRRAAELLHAEQETHARLMTTEMGKLLRAAREEVAKCALALRYYADNAASFVAPEVILDEPAQRGEVHYQPLGVVLAVMPWNFPFWQVMRFAAPALAAGNAGLLKHASNVPQCALALESLWERAGAPHGLFQTLLIESSRVEALIADARIAAVTLTGSEAAGRSVAASAGRAIKKTVLELGGSDPFIVTANADVPAAARAAVTARTINNGQSCIAAKRFFCVHAIADEFIDLFVAGMRALRSGNPLEPNTDLGPLATRAIRAELHAQVQLTVARGARCVIGGAPVEGPGFFYAPTVLQDVPNDSPAAMDELFGPVASLFRVADSDAAVTAANASKFGLGASVWTRNVEEAGRCADALACGTVFVNGIVASDPRFPFGGVKASGYGRELGVWGLREFVNIKTVRYAGSG
ncbi:MAG: NAD-dependent succinate-semialdehyde dehydrogenase [Gemmatimonadaceae bacterium]